MEKRAPGAHFLHCLRHRGEEVTAGVIDGPRSAVWRQAGNRMHRARGAMLWMLEQTIAVAAQRFRLRRRLMATS